MLRVLPFFLLVACGFDDPRSPTLTEQTKIDLLLKAQQTANWVPWCETWPSKDNCSDGDALAHGIGYLAAVGFEPSKQALIDSVKNGYVERSPKRYDTEDASSRDQFLGFLAGQLSGDKRWLEVKRHVLETNKLCDPASDGRCNMTPTVKALIGHVHTFLGYPTDLELKWSTFWFPSVLLGQSGTVPFGYQLNLVVNAAWIAYKTGNETNSTYLAVKNAYLRQQDNPWFCVVYLGPDESCAQKALAIWPEETEHKTQWSFERDTAEGAVKDSMGWEFIFLASLFGVDVNSLDYGGVVYRKTSQQH